MSEISCSGGRSANPLWGGRFEAGPAEIMEEINASIDFDRRLAEADLQASHAHIRMLATQGIVSEADRDALSRGLGRSRGRSLRDGSRFPASWKIST